MGSSSQLGSIFFFFRVGGERGGNSEAFKDNVIVTATLLGRSHFIDEDASSEMLGMLPREQG